MPETPSVPESATGPGPAASDGILAPLRYPVFRRIWLASLLSNLGILVQGVGAAWAMTQMTGRADMVALVQTALMLPVMLVSIPAGAVADMYDRRKVGIGALSLALTGAACLTAASLSGLITPWVLLAFCFLIGSGMALFSPAWQASVSEQAPPEALPSAIALNSISYNIARSFGPAIGGLLVALAGASAAFGANALLYLPLLVVLFLWKRTVEPSRLPPENLGRAIVSGVRYVANSPAIRVLLARCLLVGMAGGSISALMPVVAKNLLGGGAAVYGLMLGAFGIGAVGGALVIPVVRRRLNGEAAVTGCALILAVTIATVGLSRSPFLTAPALMLAGAAWMMGISLFNIGVQLSAPRWVTGRALATFQASISGGVAIGSWGWGALAERLGVGHALLWSAAAMLVVCALGLWLRMPNVGAPSQDAADLLDDPEVSLALTPRSGPIVMEIEYRVDPDRARDFYNLMQQVQLGRQRNGAYGWSISRDIADEALWVERYHCPTWHDYLRLRNRPTAAERALQDAAAGFHSGPDPIRVRRMLERPFGSVRWQADTPDVQPAGVTPL